MNNKKQEKSQQTKQELMAAAYELFKGKGFVCTSIFEITNHAGYAKGNFYRHWKSKNELFLDIMADRLEHYRALREPALKDARGIEDVTQVIIFFLETMVDDPNWYKVFLEFTVNAFEDQDLKAKLNTSRYRLNSTLFAQLFEPFITDRARTRKLGALVTALFDGFLIHQALETRVLDKHDLRRAILTLAQSYLPGLESQGPLGPAPE